MSNADEQPTPQSLRLFSTPDDIFPKVHLPNRIPYFSSS
jgi:hypothetical protein